MPLINCTECGKEISDKANSCISCGAPVSGPKGATDVVRPGGKWEAVGSLLLVAGFAIICTGSSVVGVVIASVGLAVFVVGRCM